MPSKSPFTLIILLGLVSLFGDLTYEGARSILGPYLLTLGASATVVGFLAGLGEFLGYTLRIISGYLTDRIKKYWSVALVGYAANLFSVPALALAKTPFQVITLVLLERIGKAVRTPARDTILSFATESLGRGKGFGIHEAMDQIGAILGPLFVSLLLFAFGDYKVAFAGLLFPALLAISIFFLAARIYPNPQKFEKEPLIPGEKGRFSSAFWLYVFAMGIYGAGYADFALIAYHFEKKDLLAPSLIPVYYAFAMGVDALSALLFGYLYDKKGLRVLIFPILLSSLFSPFIFLEKFNIPLLGMILWGIGMGAQESIMRASVSQLTPKERRATGYGIFNTLFGLFWFLGSLLLGFLYDYSISTLILVSMGLQLLSLPLLLRIPLPVRVKS